MTPEEQEALAFDTFNREIVRELIVEAGSAGTDDDVERIWSKCGGNPWNAGILWRMLHITS